MTLLANPREGGDHVEAKTISIPAQGGELKVLSLSSLSLNNFRNYTHSRLELSSAPVVITGENGAGKTNILEAVSLLAPGRGIRKARLADLDNLSAPEGWAIASNINGILGETRIGTGRDVEIGENQNDKRIVKIDGKIRPQSELSRHVSVIWLTPQMSQLFQEGASAGRKFLDRLVFGFDAEHASRINEYDYAMRERNRLLQQRGGDNIWLDALEQTMAETASAIAHARIQAVEGINHAVAISPLSFPKSHMEIAGFVEDSLKSGEAAVSVEENFKRLLMGNRNLDAASGRTMAGVHRSELKVTHTGKGMPAENCSTGEQKAVLLSIILAQARAGAIRKGIIPVILLDEVIAHLDTTRKLELFEEICQIGAQTWMTGTDADLFADLGSKAQNFRVVSGRIIND